MGQQRAFVGNFKGPKGNDGQRGSKWFKGTGITGTSGNGTVFPGSGVADALVNDYYINISVTGADRGNVYVCTEGGAANAAKWKYTGNLAGEQGPKGPQGDPGPQGPNDAELISVTDIKGLLGAVGANVSMQLLIDVIAQKVKEEMVTKGMIINTGLTTEEGYAADARQLNPNIEGTIAQQVRQQSSDIRKAPMRFESYKAAEIATGSQIAINSISSDAAWNVFLVTAYADNPAYKAVAMCTATKTSVAGLFNIQSGGQASFVVENNKLYLKNDSPYSLRFTIRAIGF